MKSKFLSVVIALAMGLLMLLTVTPPASAANTYTMTQVNAGTTPASGDVVTIASAEELGYLATYVNAGKTTSGITFQLSNDIDLNAGYTFEFDAASGMVLVKSGGMLKCCIGTGIAGTAYNSVTAGTAGTVYVAAAQTGNLAETNLTDAGVTLNTWTPIGINYKFKGIFDGGGHIINGLYYNSSATCYIGVFGRVDTSGIVKAVTLGNSYICNIYNLSGYTGGITGENYGLIQGCKNSGIIYGNYRTGGISGTNGGSVSNCSNEGDVLINSSSIIHAGGIAGEFGTITNCQNSGGVIATGSGNKYIGGIVGCYGDVANCINTGSVSASGSSADNYAGGISGYWAYSIKNCYNTGAISASGGTHHYAGGIAGYMHFPTSYCYSSNSVIGSTEGNVVGCGTIAANQKITLINDYTAGVQGGSTTNTYVTSGTTTLLEALNLWVTVQNSAANVTWKADDDVTPVNSGYPVFDTAFVPKSTDATLSALSYSVAGGSGVSLTADQLAAAAGAGATIYLAPSTAADASITLSGTCSAAVASITTNNGVSLSSGSGTATVTVTAESGATKIYTVNFAIPTKAATPLAAFAASDTAGGTLSNVSTSMLYSVDGGSTWNVITNTSIVISDVTTASGIKVYMPGNGTTTINSDVQAIAITQAAAPAAAAFTVTQPSAIGGKGSIDGITAAMEYNSGSGWTIGNGLAISNINGGTTYQVRTKASGTVLASGSYSITINTFGGTQETTPNAGFEAATMTLSGISDGMKYSVDGGTTYTDISGSAAGSIVIGGVTTASGIKVYMPGNGTTTTDSDVQTIAITQAAAPTAADFTITQPSTIGGKGSIAGITAAMEYNSGSGWTTGNGLAISNINGGTTYQVRTKASGTVLASGSYSITINTFGATQEATPNAGFEAATMTLSSISDGLKYSVDGGTTYTTINGSSAGSIVISGVTTANGIKVYMPGNGTTTSDSDVQTIAITQAAAPAAAAFTVTQPSTIGGKGSIAGITAVMEYNSGSGWTTGDGSTISDINGGTTYQVRTIASGTVLASGSYSITINNFNATQLSTPDSLVWDSSTPGKATWTSVLGVSSYSIQLYKGGTEQGSAVTGITNTYYDFTAAITAAGTGSYTFKVMAIGNGTTYSNSVQSEASTAYSYTASSNTGSSGGHNSSGSSSSTAAAPSDNASVIVNGQTQTAGTSATSTVNGQTTTTITVDSAKLEEMLEKQGTNATVAIPFTNHTDVAASVFTGQAIKNMETKEAAVEIKTENVTYTLPAGQINIDNVSAQMGQNVELKNINVNISISQPLPNTVKIVEDTANKNHYQVVVKPVEFNITCTSGTKSVEVSKFNGYVERTVAIPDGIDPSKITTGIVLNGDGTFSHVPTTLIKIEGKYYARINSLTNSTYSLIYNPKTFADVEQHWAKAYVNAMGSRLVVSGIDASNFAPDRNITRAEFAAIIVRALGLTETDKSKLFNDVKDSDWFSGSVAKANEYGIINGMGDGSFMPNRAISRQEAMVIIAKAMKIANMDTTLKEAETSTLLSRFNDSNSISAWAKISAATCTKLGVMEGSNGSLRPQSNITRAETAAVIMKMLKQAGLI